MPFPPPCFLDLSPCYTINLYDTLVSQKRVYIVLGLGYPEVGFSTRHVTFGHHWPFFFFFFFCLDISCPDTGSHVSQMSVWRDASPA